MQHPNEAISPDAVWDDTLVVLAGELAVLRARLGAAEAAIGRPGPLGAPAPPTLPTLARRVAALERQAGIVPGLDLLAGPTAAPTPRPAIATPTPRSRGQVWRDRGQAVLAALLLLAFVAWLLRPQPLGQHSAAPAAGSPSNAGPAPTPIVIAQPRSAAPLAPDYNSDLGTEFDPLVIQNSRPRYAPAPGATWTVEFVATPPPCAGEVLATTCAPAFAPARLVIRAGDTVVWNVRAGLHTVTFPATGTPAPPLYLGGPDAAVDFIETPWQPNPLAFAPQGGAAYDGTALVGSGVLNEQSPDYRLTFPQPGHYTYLDLEQPALMGAVIVLPAAGAAATP
ncbi:MAG: cupredoxin domain-containing protein [Thermomicrobiales bacterium]